MSWYEVETKIPISDYKKYKEKIEKIAYLKKKESKSDEYYAISKIGYPKKAFRIRTTGKEIVVNFKRWDKKNWTKIIVVKEEVEIKIDNKEHFLLLMRDLGFQEWVTKQKESITYSYIKDKKLSIELNNVKHLGYFIEIEYLCKKEEINLAKEKIKEVLDELDIKSSQINNTGYTKMLWKKGIGN